MAQPVVTTRILRRLLKTGAHFRAEKLLERIHPADLGPLLADLTPDELPRTEALQHTVKRFLPYWNETIAPAVRAGRRVLIVAHGNSLRALVKHLDGISDEEIVG